MKLTDIGESVAGPEKCWPGHRKVGTKPGTGKNAGKRVNDCEKIKEDVDTVDQGEYDREGDMAIGQLSTIEDAAAELSSILAADDNLPEWVQSKITKAVDYIDTARDYMKSKEGVAESSEQRWRVTVGNKSGTLSHTKTFTGTKAQAIKQAVTRFATSKNPVVTAELVKQDVSENYPKHQDLSGVSTDKLKAYLAKQGRQQGSGEGGQVKRVQAELQRRSQGVTEGGYPEVDHMPGPTIKRTQTGCKRCHGKGYVYKTDDGEVHPMNRPDAKKYKCGKCDGIGFVKVTEQGVAEGWKEDTQELEDWSKEVNKKLYQAHESQRPALARQLSKVEQKNFGSALNQGGLTELVHAALRALQKGQMVHYDPQSVGQMPFGNIVGDDARIIASSGLSKYDVTGYRGLQRAGIVDTIEQFLHLRDLADNQGQAILKYANMPPVAAWMQFIKDIGWSKDDMNEEVQAKTDDKLLAYYAQRNAEKEKQKQQQGMAEGEVERDKHYYLRNNIWRVMDGDELVHEYKPLRNEIPGAKKLLARFDDEGYDVTHVISPMGFVTYLYGKPEDDMDEGMMDNPGEEDSPVAQAIIRRILLQRTDLLAKHGPEKVGAAVDEVADFVGDVDEIGSSDVSGWVRHVEQMLGNMEQDVAEVSKATLDRYVPKAVDAHGHADFSARSSKDDPTKRSYHKGQAHTAERRRQGISRALDRMSRDQGVAEGMDTLNVGDEVIITGAVKYKGATGVVDSVGRDGNFIVVNLYNHGKQSFQSADVSNNDYAGSEAEESEIQRREMGESAPRSALGKAIREGAKVDRMVKHIAKSERESGKSADEAEDIAWATANKRGMLDNKNKKTESTKVRTSKKY